MARNEPTVARACHATSWRAARARPRHVPGRVPRHPRLQQGACQPARHALAHACHCDRPPPPAAVSLVNREAVQPACTIDLQTAHANRLAGSLLRAGSGSRLAPSRRSPLPDQGLMPQSSFTCLLKLRHEPLCIDDLQASMEWEVTQRGTTAEPAPPQAPPPQLAFSGVT